MPNDVPDFPDFRNPPVRLDDLRTAYERARDATRGGGEIPGGEVQSGERGLVLTMQRPSVWTLVRITGQQSGTDRYSFVEAMFSSAAGEHVDREDGIVSPTGVYDLREINGSIDVADGTYHWIELDEPHEDGESGPYWRFSASSASSNLCWDCEGRLVASGTTVPACGEDGTPSTGCGCGGGSGECCTFIDELTVVMLTIIDALIVAFAQISTLDIVSIINFTTVNAHIGQRTPQPLGTTVATGGAPQWVQTRVKHTDLTSGTTTQTITLLVLPIRTVVHAIVPFIKTEFTGAAVTSMTCTLEYDAIVSGGTSPYGTVTHTAFDVASLVADLTNFYPANIGPRQDVVEPASTDLAATFEVPVDRTIDEVTAGEMVFNVLLSRLPAP